MAKKSEHDCSNHFYGSVTRGVRQTRLTALKGSGGKKDALLAERNPFLLSECERLRTVGVKFFTSLPQTLWKALIVVQGDRCHFGSSIHITGLKLEKKVTVRWIKRFMTSNQIVLPGQTGKLLTTSAQKTLIEQRVAFNLGSMKTHWDLSLRFSLKIIWIARMRPTLFSRWMMERH